MAERKEGMVIGGREHRPRWIGGNFECAYELHPWPCEAVKVAALKQAVRTMWERWIAPVEQMAVTVEQARVERDILQARIAELEQRVEALSTNRDILQAKLHGMTTTSQQWRTLAGQVTAERDELKTGSNELFDQTYRLGDRVAGLLAENIALKAEIARINDMAKSCPGWGDPSKCGIHPGGPWVCHPGGTTEVSQAVTITDVPDSVGYTCIEMPDQDKPLTDVRCYIKRPTEDEVRKAVQEGEAKLREKIDELRRKNREGMEGLHGIIIGAPNPTDADGPVTYTGPWHTELTGHGEAVYVIGPNPINEG